MHVRQVLCHSGRQGQGQNKGEGGDFGKHCGTVCLKCLAPPVEGARLCGLCVVYWKTAVGLSRLSEPSNARWSSPNPVKMRSIVLV